MDISLNFLYPKVQMDVKQRPIISAPTLQSSLNQSITLPSSPFKSAPVLSFFATITFLFAHADAITNLPADR
jgi:hypothetical protein